MNASSCLLATILIISAAVGSADDTQVHDYRSPFAETVRKRMGTPEGCVLLEERKTEVSALARSLGTYVFGRRQRMEAVYSPPYRCGKEIWVIVDLVGDNVWQSEVWQFKQDTSNRSIKFWRLDGS